MLLQNADTIAAIATAQGRGGIGIIRISGNNLDDFGCGILGNLPTPRLATFSNFLDSNGDTLDQGIALYFPTPHSFTGENVLELQGHGGPAVMRLLLSRCLELGARHAEPGEFSRRAFLNGKLDLTQAESIADLIEANTAEAARSAIRSLQGDFSKAVHNLVDELTGLRMLVEAMLDFPEEEIESVDIDKREQILAGIIKRLEQTQDAAIQGCLLREGAHVVIAGQPNVGKSSLLNCLSGQEVALVSDIPGTTRDVIRQEIQIRGVPLHILDTAGLRSSEDIVENMGIERTHQTLHQADLILLLLDASKGLTSEDKTILLGLPSNVPTLIIANKSDLTLEIDKSKEAEDYMTVSAKTGAGMDDLRTSILELIGWRDQESSTFMARERHLSALGFAHTHLLQASNVISRAELCAEELRLAQRSLSVITGEFTSDDLLGEIFSRFCIGK